MKILLNPKEGKVIIFADHLSRGFSPPGSKNFRDVLHFLQLHPQDIGPNSVSNICNFQVFCEAYLQEEPTVDLFRDFYHLSRHTEFVDGPNTELGGFQFKREKMSAFLTPNIILIPRIGTRLGSIVETRLLLKRILCRVIVLTGLPTHIHSLKG